MFKEMKAFLSIILLLGFSLYGYSEYTPEQIAEWRERAEKGEAWAQHNLGVAYNAGNGVAEDKKTDILQLLSE